MPNHLTQHQRRAITFLRGAGRASEKLCRERGFSARTMGILVREGYARRESRSAVNAPFAIYHAVEEVK